jgi:type I restriction enzyme M protein
MDYAQNLPYDKRILKHYELLTYDLEEGTSKERSSLRSSIMFLERYLDLLCPHGRLVTVIDDSVLSGKKYAFARKFIRDKFIVRAVISLHGDAFQRVGARVKTSILYLVRKEGNETQPDAFMMESQYIGLDDVPRTTPESKAKLAKDLADKESNEIVENFNRFLRGKKGTWLVPASNLTERLDVKSCLPRRNDVVQDWLAQGLEVIPLEKIVKPVEECINTRSDPQKLFTFLKITYTGTPQEGDKRNGKEITYDSLTPVKENDLAVSNIAITYGSIAVVPKELEYTFVSPEFTLMRITDSRFDPYFLWGFLRSSEVKARLLSKSTGISRHRAGWEYLKDIPVPLVDSTEQKRLSDLYKEAISSQKNAVEKEHEATETLNTKLKLDNEWAVQRLKAAKPPK